MNRNQANIEARKRWGPKAYAKRYKPAWSKVYIYFVGLVENGFDGTSYQAAFEKADRFNNEIPKF